MKLIPIMTLLIVIQLGFFIFDATVNPSDQFLANTTAPDSAFSSSNVTNPFTNQTQQSVNIWDVIINPTLASNSQFIWMLLGLVGVSGAIAVSVYLLFKIDAIILFPVFTALLGFGFLPIMNLYNLIGREATGFFGCVVGPGHGVCFPSAVLQMVSCSILTIWWIWACIDFWIKSSSS